MTDDEQDNLARAVAYHRDGQFAQLVALVIGLAAKTHPEEVRAALGSVFDLSGIEETESRLMSLLSQTEAGVADQRLRLNERDRFIESLEQRTDALELRLEKAAKAFNHLAGLYQALVKTGGFKLPERRRT